MKRDIVETLTKLITLKPHSNEIDSEFLIVGFTDRYWKAKNLSTGKVFLVRKSNLKLKGSTVQFFLRKE